MSLSEVCELVDSIYGRDDDTYLFESPDSDSVAELEAKEKPLLAPLNLSADHDRADECFPGSREWVFSDFEQWLQGAVGEADEGTMRHRVWLLQGGASSGKTVCLSVLAKRFRHRMLGEYYCHSKAISGGTTEDHTTMCTALCAQMAKALGPVFHHAVQH